MTDLSVVAREILEYQLLRVRDPEPAIMGPAELHQATACAWAFGRLGLLSEAEATDWHARLREAAEPWFAVVEDESAHPRPRGAIPPPPDVAVVTVEAVLEEHLQWVERARAAPHSGAAPAMLQRVAVADAVITALADLRLLDEAAERRWRKRLERTREGVPTVEHPVQAAPAVALTAEAMEPDLVPQPAEPLVHPRPSCTHESLLAIDVLSSPPSADSQLTSLERYADGFVVNYRCRPRLAFNSARPGGFARAARVSDDLETHYFSCGATGGGGEVMRMSASFAPAIATDAKTLLIVIGDEGFKVALPRLTTADAVADAAPPAAGE